MGGDLSTLRATNQSLIASDYCEFGGLQPANMYTVLWWVNREPATTLRATPFNSLIVIMLPLDARHQQINKPLQQIIHVLVIWSFVEEQPPSNHLPNHPTSRYANIKLFHISPTPHESLDLVGSQWFLAPSSQWHGASLTTMVASPSRPLRWASGSTAGCESHGAAEWMVKSWRVNELWIHD